ncbi:MAG: glycosyltransferase family 61 protein [Candidatus Omnitrophota bacterium]
MKSLFRKDLLASLEPEHVYFFGSEEYFSHQRPITIDERLPIRIKTALNPHILERPFVCEVSDAKLLGREAIGYTAKNELIYETLVYRKQPPLLPIDNLLPPQVELGTAVSLIAWGVMNASYYHWVTERLMLLEGVEHYSKLTKRKPLLIVPSHLMPWHVESLKVMGYELKDCVEWKFTRARVKRLVIPSVRRYSEQKDLTHHCISPSACKWFRHKILSNLPAESEAENYSRRIFVSRRKAPARRILNEAKLMELLRPMGFVSYMLEDMSFTQQARLFSSAEIVIAPHGAGLTNILFSNNISIVELFPKDYDSPSYFCISRIFGFNYGLLICKIRDKKYYDNIVDLDGFIQLLKKMKLY